MAEIDRNESLRLGIRDRVLRRAVTDEDFRRLLKDNPKSAIARELGIDVPDDVHITVLAEDPNHVFVVLPTRPQHPDLPVVTGLERLAFSTGMPGYTKGMPGYSIGMQSYAVSMPAYGGPNPKTK